MRKLVCIDAGHGDQGLDFGAVSRIDGTRESDIALAIAKLTRHLLIKSGFDVLMTRETKIGTLPMTDSQVGDLPARVRLANKADAACYVSIHLNSVVSKTARGYEIFYPKACQESLRLAGSIQNEIHYLTQEKIARVRPPMRFWRGLVDRGLKTDDARHLYILRKTNMPAVLVECLFISNPDDLEIVKSLQGLMFFALSIAGGVKKWLES